MSFRHVKMTQILTIKVWKEESISTNGGRCRMFGSY